MTSTRILARLLGAAFVGGAAACSPANPPALQNGPALRGQGASAVASPGDSGVAGDDAGDAGATPADTGAVRGEAGFVDAAAPTEAGHGTTFDAAVFGDASGLTPFDDAAAPPTAPPGMPLRGGGGDATVCAQSLGWIVSGATLDPTVVPADAVGQLNPLLSIQHPLTLADLRSDAGMLLQVSGTLANGISQQYFPYQYPATPAPLTISTASALPSLTSQSASEAPSTGWVHVVDVSSTDVWIPLTAVSTTATAGDALCQSLTDGQVDAVIPSSGGSVSLSLAGGVTTIAALFGAPSSVTPPGWTVRVLFPSAAIAQVTFK